ncbi:MULTISPECIES: COX15/CtaA family protein [Bacillaceae]|uniref:COX15/CtaA family protein n=1 Tax=Bacillaceae TaxID=186817 RepID=UPI000C78C41C|nr:MULTISPECIES: heme A synthase [Bacillaceae]PLR69611.1 heme A synthase [Bacillus sp. UMB0893]
MQRALKWLGVLTTIIMLFVLLGGALVTKTESGAGCGDSWPLCHGQLIPSDITPELVIELSHRAVSGLAGIFVLLLAVSSWILIGYKRETKFLAGVSLFFLILQALIGAAAVKWGQSDAVLALHFGISLISFASVLLLTLLIFEVDKKFNTESLIIDKRMKFHMIGIISYTYIVVYTGAYVRHKGASLACPNWPMCSNRPYGLPATLHEWIQMGHRFAAALIFIWIAVAAYTAIKHYKHQRVVYYGWMIAFTLVSLQVISGALVVLTGLNLSVALAHALIISCLFGVLSYFILLLSRNKMNRQAHSSKGNKKAM